MSAGAVFDEIAALFAAHGHETYGEGVTMAEATNDLAFLVTGAYGHPVAKQQGAPLRLALPWKYGFKSIKSIVKFTFTDKRPKGSAPASGGRR